ncbi:hypothetical protein CPB83DRAFT_848858 [Crepidotus variabilis]|uniref:G domain-containing protein n=1 Tax=Crepidotus variabilis TaxID=179855 RepID=A0A9P6JSW2_9AGAR|nr:hypothetical protein CPB83DRAFT_848858 [Crepidotus variabilis]
MKAFFKKLSLSRSQASPPPTPKASSVQEVASHDAQLPLHPDLKLTTVRDSVKNIERFRILCVGCSGVGKSSLINLVFGVHKARVSKYIPGESDIEQEYISDQNEYFVLHDSKGFEPGDTSTFNVACNFVSRRSEMKELKDRLHAIWLCTETPASGGRIFERGDEKLLQLAHEKGIPTVIVFTRYDKLVEIKKAELLELDDKLAPELAMQSATKQASEVLNEFVQSARRTMKNLNIPRVEHAKVSIYPGYDADAAYLVELTRDIVQKELQNDEWVMWSVAQRASLPVKIDACVDKGINYYHLSMAGAAPGSVGKILLRECLSRVHQDIVTCWNFENGEKVLNSEEFRQLMLYLVKDVHEKSPSSTPPDIDKIANFVTLVTAASAPIAPPVAILGLSFFFLKWLSDTVLDNLPSVERIIMAYTVDLILVLKSYFDFMLRKPGLAGKIDWIDLKEAFEAYERTDERQRNHEFYRSTFEENKSLDRDAFRAKIRELLTEDYSIIEPE